MTNSIFPLIKYQMGMRANKILGQGPRRDGNPFGGTVSPGYAFFLMADTSCKFLTIETLANLAR